MRLQYAFGFLLLIIIPIIISIFMMYERETACFDVHVDDADEGCVNLKKFEICTDEPAGLVIFDAYYSFDARKMETMPPDEWSACERSSYLGLCRLLENSERPDGVALGNIIDSLENETAGKILDVFGSRDTDVDVLLRVYVDGEAFVCNYDLKKQKSAKPLEFYLPVDII